MNPRERGELEQFIDNILEGDEEFGAGGSDDTLPQVAKQAGKDTTTDVVMSIIGTQAMGYLKGLRVDRGQNGVEESEIKRIEDMVNNRENKIREMFGTEKSNSLFGL